MLYLFSLIFQDLPDFRLCPWEYLKVELQLLSCRQGPYPYFSLYANFGNCYISHLFSHLQNRLLHALCVNIGRKISKLRPECVLRHVSQKLIPVEILLRNFPFCKFPSRSLFYIMYIIILHFVTKFRASKSGNIRK